MRFDELNKPLAIVDKLHAEICAVLNEYQKRVAEVQLTPQEKHILIFEKVDKRCGIDNNGFNKIIGAIENIRFSHKLIWHYRYKICSHNKLISAGLNDKYLPDDTRFLIDLGLLSAVSIQFYSVKAIKKVFSPHTQTEKDSLEITIKQMSNSKILKLRHRASSHNVEVEGEADSFFPRYLDSEVGYINVFSSTKIYGEDFNLLEGMGEFYELLDKALMCLLKEFLRRLYKNNESKLKKSLKEIESYFPPELPKFI